jgi:RNA polymerase sigma factor (TIGR02999 family)
MSDLTRILEAVEGGNRQAANELLPLVYDELRKLAAQHLANEKPGQTLQPTALVHEAYLRLASFGAAEPAYARRSHFFAAAAQAMRRILVEQARRKNAIKRGAAAQRHDLGEVPAPDDNPELLDLDAALDRLAALDPVKARLVELRHFAGLTGEQAATALGISPTTADRYWAYARAWLQAEVRG